MAKDKAEFYMQKIEGREMFHEDVDAFIAFKELAPSGRYTVEVKRIKKKKTLNQLGYIFGGIIATIKEEVNETRQDGVDALLKYLVDEDIPKGQIATDDFLKELCYSIAPTYSEGGRRKTLSSMNTAEANSFMERIRNILANFVVIDEPDPNWKNK